METGKPVRFGQCWVFSGIVTSCKDQYRDGAAGDVDDAGFRGGGGGGSGGLVSSGSKVG